MARHGATIGDFEFPMTARALSRRLDLSPATVERWICPGVNGVRLGTNVVDGERVVTREAWSRFRAERDESLRRGETAPNPFATRSPNGLPRASQATKVRVRPSAAKTIRPLRVRDRREFVAHFGEEPLSAGDLAADYGKHRSTIWKWFSPGVGGIRLECHFISREKVSYGSAVARFLAAIKERGTHITGGGAAAAPSRRDGNVLILRDIAVSLGLSWPAVLKWSTHGVGGVVLESHVAGGRRVVTVEHWKAFVAARAERGVAIGAGF